MPKKMKAPPPGLDYRPVTGDTGDLSFGVVQAEERGKTNTAVGAVFRRLYPVMRPQDSSAPWVQPTCFKAEVFLPAGASDEYWDPQRLATAYDSQGFSVQDILVVLTLRFPEVEAKPPTLRLHEAWSLATGFVTSRIVKIYRVAAICVFHVPARAARPGPPHVHVLIPARELLPSGFGKFARPLTTDEGREIMDKEWAAWRKDAANG